MLSFSMKIVGKGRWTDTEQCITTIVGGKLLFIFTKKLKDKRGEGNTAER